MFRFAVVLGILSYTNCGLVVFMYHSWLCLFLMKIFQKPSQPSCFLACTSQSHILGFSRRESNTSLFSASPTNRCATHHEKIRRGRLSVTYVTRPIGTRISTHCFVVSRVQKTIVRCSIQIPEYTFHCSPMLFSGFYKIWQLNLLRTQYQV